MAKATKLTVTSTLGTFTRTTARTYTHLVVVKGYRAEVREAQRQANLANAKKTVAEYRLVVATGVCQNARPGTAGDWDRKCTAQFLAEGIYTKLIATLDAKLADPVLNTPITKDDAGDYGVIGWCGRLDLADKLVDQQGHYRHVAIIDVATGAVVQEW